MKTAGYDGTGGWGHRGAPSGELEFSARASKTGLKLLMAVITSLFFLFLIAFMIRSQLGDWEHLSGPWKPLEDPWQLYVNTAMLALGSLCLQWASVSSRRGKMKPTVEGLILGGIFAAGFILGQLWVWRQLVSLGYYVNSNPANSFFYLLTGLHGLHLLGGMVAWLKTVIRAWKGARLESFASSVQLCALYWHYLLALWIVLLVLLTSSPENYAAFARLCGF